MTAATPLPDELLSELAAMPDQLDRALACFPVVALRFRPAAWGGSPGENFSALEHVCHVRDLEVDGYQARFRRMLEEHEPALVSIDGYELSERRRYADTDPRDALAAFRSARAETLALLLGLDKQQLARRGSFAEYGQVSLLGLIHFLRSHDQQHLACFQWLLGKYASEVSGGAAPPA